MRELIAGTDFSRIPRDVQRFLLFVADSQYPWFLEIVTFNTSLKARARNRLASKESLKASGNVMAGRLSGHFLAGRNPRIHYRQPKAYRCNQQDSKCLMEGGVNKQIGYLVEQ